MKKLWQWLVTALLVAIFLSLANWQWNRASELKHPPKIDETVLPIDSVIAPNASIKQEQVGRRVLVTGHYLSTWIAPNQQKNKSGNREWDVALFQTKDNAAILIVRGYHRASALPVGQVTVTGYLVPQQSEDVADTQGNQIGRVDSSLFVTKTELPLYAPYVNAISEEPKSNYETVPFNIQSSVPGFYWQHISYVVIWFLFALTAIYLMMYQRKLDKVKP